LPADAALWILAPLVAQQRGEFRDLFEDLRKQGFSLARVDGQTVSLADPPPLDRQRRHQVEVVVDRIEPADRMRGRIGEAVDVALKLAQASVIASLSEPGAAAAGPPDRDH